MIPLTGTESAVGAVAVEGPVYGAVGTVGPMAVDANLVGTGLVGARVVGPVVTRDPLPGSCCCSGRVVDVWNPVGRVVNLRSLVGRVADLIGVDVVVMMLVV